MKCTCVVNVNGKPVKCGKETGKPTPPIWRRHAHFDPRVIRIFFAPVQGELISGVTEEDLALLDNFVCPDCMPVWQQGSRASAAGRKAKLPKPPDYQI